MDKAELLKSVNFGQRIAEEETDYLSKYFIETEDWRKVFNGDIDVIYGSKGAGKSAIYAILDNNSGNLFDRGILLTTAENPRGNTVFEGLSTDPPTEHSEFVKLWKLYFLVITISELDSWGIKNKYSEDLKSILQDSGLVPPQEGLKAILKICRDYIRNLVNLESVEPGLEINENTGVPSGFKFKVSFREPNKNEINFGVRSIDSLYEILDKALGEAKITLWIAIDRLDVAFIENLELETNALKALFKAYRDISSVRNIKLKIFLRDDIWRRITEEGFREASHITKTITIKWTRESLVNLITMRLINNPSVVEYYGIDIEKIKNNYELQEELFYRLFPVQIEVGDKKPKTIDWILGRLKDGKDVVAPREIIHLFNESAQEQIKMLNMGQSDLEDENIIGRTAFKSALSTVSKVRLEQTIYAEFPSLKKYIQRLEGEKTEQRIETLARIWEVSNEETKGIAKRLADIGFFAEKGDVQNPRFWVPFIYRNELGMVQGAAD